MPELPEVSVVVKYLNETITNKKLIKIETIQSKILKNSTPLELNQTLKNQCVNKIRRRGKYILIDFEHNTLVIHLRMEGKLEFFENDEFISQKHDCVYLYFSKGVLVYNDVRKFGTFEVVNFHQEQTLKGITKLGLEYDDIKLTPNYLWKKLNNKNQAIKTQLLSQLIFTGLGNIYVDEVLIASHIHPLTQSKNLTLEECENIILNSQKIMKKSIQYGGTTVKSYTSGKNRKGSYQQFLLVYGRNGKRCLQCHNANIEKIKVNGRGTHFCPNCQKQK